MSISEPVGTDLPNSVSTFGYLNISGAVLGHISTDWEEDWYAVYLEAGRTYQFNMWDWNSPSYSFDYPFDSYFGLFNSNGIFITQSNEDGLLSLDDATIIYTPISSGIYYVAATGTFSPGSYAISVSASGMGGDIPGDNSTANVLAVGSSVSSSIGAPGDADCFGVNLTAGVAYGFAVTGGTLPSPYLWIHSGYWNYYDGAYDPGGEGSFTLTPDLSGTYYLEVSGNNPSNTGTYTVAAWVLPTVSISGDTVTEGNSGTTNLVFTLSLSSASPIPVTVSAASYGISTATEGSDFSNNSSLITFLPGQTTATYSVPVLGDTNFEPTEVLYVALSFPDGAVLGDEWFALGTIEDNDNPYSWLPTDSYLDSQWYLYDVTGVNVFRVWPDYTGAGVRVAVFDQGIDPSHPDLDGNLLTTLGRNASNLSIGGSPILSTDNHGTAVAGCIAAENNGAGVVGVAYGADLISIYQTGSETDIPNAFNYAANFDILNNSWGFAPQGYTPSWSHWAFLDNFDDPAFAAAGIALGNLALQGRGGLGTIVVQSAGNSYEFGDDTNLHNFQNSQFIITVAATDYFGNVTSYSSPGASILVSAPGGGGSDDASNIFTTDRVGSNGYDQSDYNSIRGTSFSAPIVSGVVALMLEANPNLGYRDVQEILAYSARLISPIQNDWEYNGANNWNGGGLHYDSGVHNLGFGLVDALAAVRLAETWGSAHTFTNIASVSATSTPNLAIPDFSIFGTSDSVSVTQSIDVERVEATINITHTYVGDLAIRLTSPSGTESWLLWRPQQNPLSAFGTDQNDIHFTFDTVLDWGEGSIGTWTLSVFDLAGVDIGKLDSWTLHLIGKPTSDDDTYIFTNEFSEALFGDATRGTLTDAAGNDILNAAAVTTDSIINLAPGATSTIDGDALYIDSGTIIEDVSGGDGDDTIIGNVADNQISGMRGSDRLTGGGGNDTFLFSDAWAGTDRITDFSTGDIIQIEAANFSAAVVAGNGSAVGLNQIQVSSGGGTTSLFIGTDTVAGADVTVSLSGTFAASQFAAGGNDIWLTFTNHAPTVDHFIPDQYATESAVFSFTFASNTFSDIDVGDTLVYTATLSNGSPLPAWLSFNPNTHAFSGTPGSGDVGFINVKVTASDGLASTADIFSITVLDANYVSGSSGDDSFTGGAEDNYYDGLAGNDTAFCWDGNDTVVGGSGNDSLHGNMGNDSVVGGSGNDTVMGGKGFDWISGDLGDDLVRGGEDNDTLRGEGGNDTLLAGKGDDSLNGGDGDDRLDSRLGNDTMTGGAGADTFQFASTLNGATNVDVITDFATGQDEIWLDPSIFSALSFSTGSYINLSAYLLYNSGTGVLSYDADGAGLVAAVAFANVGPGITFGGTDFFVGV